MKQKTIKTVNGGTITLDRPATPAQKKAALAAIAKRDADDAAKVLAEKEAAKAAKAAFAESTQGKAKARMTAEEKAAKKAADKAAADAKAAEKAAAKLGDAKGKEAEHAATHAKADKEAEAGAVRSAVIARGLFCERVLKVSDKHAHNLLRVSGRGVTLPRFADGVRILAFHKAFPVDAEGKLSAPHFATCRAVYNRANDALNTLLAKVDAAQTTKYTVSASPKPKKGGKERSATIAKRTKVNLATLAKAKAMTVEGWNALLSVCDTSARVLDSGAALLINNPVELAKIGNGAAPKFGRHLGNMRASATVKRPAYASDETLAMIEKKGADAAKAVEILPFLLIDAQAFNLAEQLAKEKAKKQQKAQRNVA